MNSRHVIRSCELSEEAVQKIKAAFPPNPMNSPDLEALADDVQETADAVMTFARTLTGIQAEQSFAACVQISGALGLLAKKIRSRKEQSR
jgi:hypothetical protein